MSSELLLDAAGRRRSPAAMPGHNAGQAPRNKGRVYPADPPTVDEIVAVMRQTPPDRHGLRGPGADRGAVARRTADPGSAVADRVRSRPAPRVDPDSLWEREPSAGSRDGRLGVVRSSRAMARCPCRAAGRRAVLRDRRADARPAVVSDRRAGRAAPLRARGWRSAQVRASSAEACACCRARTRRRAAACHPTAARTFVRVHNQRVSAGDRRRGDHRHDPRAASADDARQRRPRTLRREPSDDRVGGGPRGSSPAGPRLRALLLFANAAATRSPGGWPRLLRTNTDGRLSRIASGMRSERSRDPRCRSSSTAAVEPARVDGESYGYPCSSSGVTTASSSTISGGAVAIHAMNAATVSGGSASRALLVGRSARRSSADHVPQWVAIAPG
jgi:hypothetical protein